MLTIYYTPIYSSESSLLPGTPPKGLATAEKSPLFHVEIIIPSLCDETLPFHLQPSHSCSPPLHCFHLTCGFPTILGPSISLSYTFLVNSPSCIVYMFPNHLNVVHFTHSTNSSRTHTTLLILYLY